MNANFLFVFIVLAALFVIIFFICKKEQRTILFRLFISLIIGMACLYFAAQNVHWKELKTILSSAKIAPILIGMAMSLITLTLRSFRWKILLNPFQNISTLVLFRWQVGGLFVNNMISRMGEFTRAYWTGHKSAISKSTVMATIVVERVLDVFSIALVAVLVLFFIGFDKLNSLLNFQNVITAFIILLILILSITWIMKRFDKEFLFQKLKNLLPAKMAPMLDNFVAGLKIVQDKEELVKISLLSPIIWSIDIAIIAVVSTSLELNLTLMQAGFVMVGFILGAMIPAPAAVATYEGGGVAALAILGIEKSLALSFILLLHASQLFLITSLGIPVLIIEGFNPKKLFENTKNNSG